MSGGFKMPLFKMRASVGSEMRSARRFEPGTAKTVIASSKAAEVQSWGRRADAKLRKFSWESEE